MYREQWENYTPTPDELKELKRNSGCKRPSYQPRILFDADTYGLLVVLAVGLLCIWMMSL
jgi:hypothetical protein